MEFVVSFDSSTANAPAGFKACINAVCQYYDQVFTNNAVVTLTVGYGSIDGQTISAGSIGESLSSYINADYNQVASALRGQNAPGASTLPASSPAQGTLQISTAEGKALGVSTLDGAPDGYVGFDSTVTWAFDPTQSKAMSANSIDFMGTAEHEISEVMGRSSQLDQSGSYGVLDLFRYSAAGVRQLTSGDPSYFSVDGGHTVINSFNNPVSGDSGDLGDWTPNSTVSDAFNDDASTGVTSPVSAGDITEMASLGWTQAVNAQSLTVAGAVPTLTAASAISALANNQDAYVSIADSAANIVANLATLIGDASAGQLSSVAVTGAAFADIALSASQLSADSAFLSILSGNYYLTVDATASPNLTYSGPSGGHGAVIQLSGSASQYTITPGGDGVSFTVGNGSSTDHLSNVTALQFGSATDIVAATPGSNGTVTSGNITELYGAVFGREPDIPGLAYYQNTLNANPSLPLTTFAQWFLQSSEYVNNTAHNYAQTTAGDTQFIDDSYNNLLHRAPETGAVPYYLNLISQFTAGLTPGTAAYTAAELAAHATVITDFSQSAEFLGDVQITAQHPADSQHWLYLI